ncbi:Hsp20/alpha crystallin family protein [Thermoproteota archaeon]
MRELMPRSRGFLRDFFDDSLFAVPQTLVQMKFPAIDFKETDKCIIIKAEVPGMDKKDLQVTYENGLLTIKGEKQGQFETEEEEPYYRESWKGAFERSIQIGEKVEGDSIEAKCMNGVLEVTVPKKNGGKESKLIDIH